MASIQPAYNAVGIGQTFIFATDLTGSIAWSVNAGSPTSGSGSAFIWTAPGSPVVARIEADNGTLNLIRNIRVLNVYFGIRPSLAVDGTEDDVTLIHRMMNGSRRGRRKTPSKQAWELKFNNRTIDEYDTAIDVLEPLGKTTPFLMDDPITGVTLAWYRDSAITKQYFGRDCAINYAFRVKEA